LLATRIEFHLQLRTPCSEISLYETRVGPSSASCTEST